MDNTLLRWCHHCRSKKRGVQCKNKTSPILSGKKPCKKVFCGQCLSRYYDQELEDCAEDREWRCPFCLGACRCSNCSALDADQTTNDALGEGKKLLVDLIRTVGNISHEAQASPGMPFSGPVDLCLRSAKSSLDTVLTIFNMARELKLQQEAQNKGSEVTVKSESMEVVPSTTSSDDTNNNDGSTSASSHNGRKRNHNHMMSIETLLNGTTKSDTHDSSSGSSNESEIISDANSASNGLTGPFTSTSPSLSFSTSSSPPSSSSSSSSSSASSSASSSCSSSSSSSAAAKESKIASEMKEIEKEIEAKKSELAAEVKDVDSAKELQKEALQEEISEKKKELAAVEK
eukprot:GILJ01001131.1.p1 GENE.GILJ01001131.1~~GILJ01001131.1.p1  ORF type:complete len:345 (+),score=85.96 GILJ01001131.1:74-1108(+)